jgi:hypothetical protein
LQTKYKDGELKLEDIYQCKGCNKQMLGNQIFKQQEAWELTFPKTIYDAMTLADFLHRTCPICGESCRLFHVGNMTRGDLVDTADFAELEKQTASKYVKIEPDQKVDLKMTKMRKSENSFGSVGLKFDVTEQDGAVPLADGTTYEAYAASLIRAFLAKVKELGKTPEEASALEFNVSIARTGEGNNTRYVLEFKE